MGSKVFNPVFYRFLPVVGLRTMSSVCITPEGCAEEVYRLVLRLFDLGFSRATIVLEGGEGGAVLIRAWRRKGDKG